MTNTKPNAPDDRTPSLTPDGDAAWYTAIPPRSADVDYRTTAFLNRCAELRSLGGLAPDEAIARTYREFDRIHRADDTAPGLRGTPTGAKVILAILVVLVLTFLIPAVGFLMRDVVIPLWRAAFTWW